MLVLAMGCCGGADGALVVPPAVVVAAGTGCCADRSPAGMEVRCCPAPGAAASVVPGNPGAPDSTLGSPAGLAAAGAGARGCTAAPGRGLVVVVVAAVVAGGMVVGGVAAVWFG